MESNLPSQQPRQQLPGCIMLAALPHRRVSGERSAITPTLTATVCPNIIDVSQAGFTLVELSIVLVIIGLVVGGVLVGRDLIAAAAVRAQISQIERYQQAVNSFQGKYGYLPGDIPPGPAAQFGFIPRGTDPAGGTGDGNGVIQGNCGGGCASGIYQGYGETVVFWVDLSTSGLIDGGFTTASNSQYHMGTTNNTTPNLSAYFPQAKIGQQNFVFVWSGGVRADTAQDDSINYFGLSAITGIGMGGGPWPMTANKGLTVAQASNIDKKIDDGYPLTGNVKAQYIDYNTNHWVPIWASGYYSTGSTDLTDASAIVPSATSCYDNNNNSANVQQYSITKNNGAGVNCALSFKFQ